MASKSTTAAENVYAPLVMVSLWARKRTLAGKRGHHNRSIDTILTPLSSHWTVPLMRSSLKQAFYTLDTIFSDLQTMFN